MTKTPTLEESARIMPDELRRMLHRAIFLDRDGVLNANLVRDGKSFAPRSLADFRILPGVEEAVHCAKSAGFLTIVVTNQPDVANGLTSRSTVDAMHDELRRVLWLDDIKACLHVDADQCACRKPKAGMIFEAAAERAIDLRTSYMIGDRWRDVLAGQVAGCFTIFVDYGLAQERPAHPDKVVASLAEAVDFILARESGGP
jgi:D-glycero-D-manno-heptose 1,7-bisphosphate phosphatase